MGLILNTSTIIRNLSIGPLSGGGNSGGGASSKLLIGAIGFNSNAGRAYVYDTSNFSATPTILSPSSTNDYLGDKSTSIDSVYTTLGSVGDDDLGSGAGAVYVYDSTNYSSSPTKLAPSGMISGNYMFGYSTLVTSNYIAAGALRDSTAGSSAGAVYIFNTSNLAATPTRLTVTKTISSDEFFGGYLAANSTQLVVGAEMYNNQKGAIYVYDPNNLSAPPTQLAPSDLVPGDRFGSRIAANDSYIVVGAYRNDNSKGAVYVYDATNLAASPTKLVPSSAANDDLFGESVAIYNNMIVVGAYGDDPLGSYSGNAFVYDANNLSAAPTELYPSDGSSNDQFGISVSVDANYIAVGAHRANSNTGAVYVYDATNLSATPIKLTGAANDRFGSSVSLG